MKGLYLIIVMLMSFHAYSQSRVVYGHDNRKDIYLVKNPLHLELARATAVMVPYYIITPGAAQGLWDIEAKTLEEGYNVCPTERFSQQPFVGTCSGFLVGPDTLVTAGHCYLSLKKKSLTPEQSCALFSWVFDFNMKSPTDQPEKNIPGQNIYKCKKIVAANLKGLNDFSVIKLDRPVVGRRPLNFRVSGKVDDRANLMVIGNPTGLPTKVSVEGRIFDNRDPMAFITNLDSFSGNSGSAVFDTNTGLVEGILIEGKQDYVPSLYSNPNSCLVVNKCKTNGQNCREGDDRSEEVVFRISQISGIIQQSFGMR